MADFRDTIEEVRSRNDIVDVISQHVKLTKRGSTYFGLCPFHNEKTPSFSVTPSKQMYYCFGCGAGGNVFTFVMQYDNCSFYEALTYLAERAHVELPKIDMSQASRERHEEREKLLEINKLAAQFYYYQLRQEGGRTGWNYLTGRGLTEETIKTFGLGYSGKYSNTLYRYLKEKGYPDALLRESGLFTSDEKHGMTDKFWNRVIFPIMDVNRRVIGFGGRVMGDGKPKYLNSPETKIFDKGRNLYGLHAARTSRKKNLILCEGYMDVISMHQAGFTNAVASLGTAFTSGHASLLRRYTDEVLLLYDSDDAGVRAAQRAIPILRDAGISARVVHLSPYKDPDEFIRARGPEEFEKRLSEAEDSFLFRVHTAEREFDMNSPQDQNRFFGRCAGILLEFPDELERSIYIEALVKEYRNYGITADILKKRVASLAMRGMPAEDRTAPRPTVPENRMKQQATASETAQKLILTWLANDPSVFRQVKRYISADDFVEPFYRQVAEKVFLQLEEGNLNPGMLLNDFTDSEDQQKAAALFHARIPLRSDEEKNGAFADAVLRIRSDSLEKKNREWDPGDMKGLEKLIRDKKELENLEKNKYTIKIVPAVNHAGFSEPDNQGT